jgi:LmbE family N-acetylglucosaminyl deacetylase
LLLLLTPRLLDSQERGAVALGEAVLGLGVNTRVLMIGAHPDDEDTYLIAWLSRGRYVKTAYLSLTRGDGGQNLIGNELGEALGVIRTEELLAARRIDGADQYFTRAFDFGFSKDTVDTYAHWPKDSILGDVVRVVRAFRPHVIVAVFSGTPRDGHGHHQVSGLLAREAYDVSADTVRFPVTTHGRPWTTSKFYRAARGNAQGGTLGVDVGEYSPLLGRSYAEIAGLSLSQHKSQGFGVMQRKGPVMNYVRREATRVNEAMPAASEKSLFDGIDTTWTRFRRAVPDSRFLDSLSIAFAAARSAYDPFAPGRTIAPLSHALNLFHWFAFHVLARRGSIPAEPDLETSLYIAYARITEALRLATGIAVEANAPEVTPLDSVTPVAVSVFNRGRDTVTLISPRMTYGGSNVTVTARDSRKLPPGGVLRDTLMMTIDSLTQPWWLARGRDRGMFGLPAATIAENRRASSPVASYPFSVGGYDVQVMAPVVWRYVDQVRGEVEHESQAAPAVLVAVEERSQYARANEAIDREIGVRVQSVDRNAREVRVTLTLPPGLVADSSSRAIRLERNAERTVRFRVRGRLSPGPHSIVAVAHSAGQSFTLGTQLIDYEHIRRQRIYRPAEITVSAVDVRVPGNLSVGYIAGVGDNVAPTLAQLGIPVTLIPAADIARAQLSGFTTLVIGPRAYEAHPELVAANQRILDFARRGGTVVTQYGQYEMTQPGILPHPITINRPHDRVTHEESPVRVLEPAARELSAPNRISDSDFAGWVQERALYMPRTIDEHWRALLGMNDPGEPENRGAILVAALGEGRYIYTTAAFFRQLPAGVPGAARLFVNLLSAGLEQTRTTP